MTVVIAEVVVLLVVQCSNCIFQPPYSRDLNQAAIRLTRGCVNPIPN